eukprot:TRINITY_DN4962_c1_g2_i1.p1 TRINITY_DN4962_c1_g2~~TRINITY_DN4962_c1_g2_i1.p1  ORF type:complete len:754 (-),score=139.09 TRINITY_DN4962_c1_g2_i1:144-2222(-)
MFAKDELPHPAGSFTVDADELLGAPDWVDQWLLQAESGDFPGDKKPVQTPESLHVLSEADGLPGQDSTPETSRRTLASPEAVAVKSGDSKEDLLAKKMEQIRANAKLMKFCTVVDKPSADALLAMASGETKENLAEHRSSIGAQMIGLGSQAAYAKGKGWKAAVHTTKVQHVIRGLKGLSQENMDPPATGNSSSKIEVREIYDPRRANGSRPRQSLTQQEIERADYEAQMLAQNDSGDEFSRQVSSSADGETDVLKGKDEEDRVDAFLSGQKGFTTKKKTNPTAMLLRADSKFEQWNSTPSASSRNQSLEKEVASGEPEEESRPQQEADGKSLLQQSLLDSDFLTSRVISEQTESKQSKQGSMLAGRKPVVGNDFDPFEPVPFGPVLSGQQQLQSQAQSQAQSQQSKRIHSRNTSKGDPFAMSSGFGDHFPMVSGLSTELSTEYASGFCTTHTGSIDRSTADWHNWSSSQQSSLQIQMSVEPLPPIVHVRDSGPGDVAGKTYAQTNAKVTLSAAALQAIRMGQLSEKTVTRSISQKAARKTSQEMPSHKESQDRVADAETERAKTASEVSRLPVSKRTTYGVESAIVMPNGVLGSPGGFTRSLGNEIGERSPVIPGKILMHRVDAKQAGSITARTPRKETNVVLSPLNKSAKKSKSPLSGSRTAREHRHKHGTAESSESPQGAPMTKRPKPR